ncbi:hypothetical protein ACF0H5_007573 [Mactra antiquata]
MENKDKIRVCVIGAGPSGMSVLYQFAKLRKIPNIVCYEKQSTWGGIWNYTWRTGLDDNNEPCHSSLYKDLWTNAPKEANLEFPDYTFEKHFGKPVPSYPPAAAVRDYLQGRWTNACSTDLKQFIQFNTIVRFVKFENDNFVVTIDDRKKNMTKQEVFSHVVICSGVFNYPNQPEVPDIIKFEGRVMHSHNFRNANEFKGQTVLVIGSHYSGEDIALHCLKYGAKHIYISWRTQPTGLKWPKGIEERPGVTRFDAKNAYFKDGSRTAIDAVIFCTGFRNHFPYLDTNLRIGEDTSLYPDGLYKATLFLNGGNNKLFYIGAQDQLYSFNYFDCIASWVCKYILGELADEPKSGEKMKRDVTKWTSRVSTIASLKDVADFQTDLLAEICSSSGYDKSILKAVSLFVDWIRHREEDISDFRRHQFRSMYTGSLAPTQKPYMTIFDDSLETFLKC